MEGTEQLLTTPAIPPTVNRDLLAKLQNTPYVYVRENLCFVCCTKSFDVFTAPMVVTNFGELSELLYTVKDECPCDHIFQSCAKLNFYAPDNSQQLWFTYPGCCENLLCCKLCKCKCECKCDPCHNYSEPLIGYYGNTKDVTLGHYRRQYCCVALCCQPTWILYDKTNNESLKVRLSCYDHINPCSKYCKINFEILRGEQTIGQLTRNPRCICNGFTYEIQFPANTSVEDRLLLIALCCKAV